MKIILPTLKAIAHLPLRMLYGLSDVAFVLLYYIIRYRRATVRQNLENSFPEKTVRERRQTERKFYRHMCDLFAETIKLLHISDQEMLRRVEVRGQELMEQAAAEGKPVFLMMSHTGNWEWAQEITRRIKAPTVHGEIYRRVASKATGEVMEAIRHRYPTLLIPQDKAARTIIALKRQHSSYLIGFITDQRPNRRSLDHWTTFLNQDTPYIVGAEEIGRHVGAKHLYLHVEKPRRGYYIMEIRDMKLPRPYGEYAKDEFPYTLQYMQMLEADIRERPELWLWSHKRWKHKRVKN